jgi:integrase
VLSHQIELAAQTLPQSKLEELKAALHKAYKKRFRTPKEPKYGSINKAFTELELQHFLRNVKSDKFRLLFKYQAYLGLRVGEVSKLHISNINFDKRELTLKSEKSGRLDALIIPLDLYHETVEYIAKNEARLRASNGHVFYKDNDNNHNKLPHVDVNYVRKVFRDTIQAAGLDTVYGHSEETYADHNERRLFRLSTHSLRHYAITRFAKSTNGNIVLTSRFARHSRPDITMTYIAKDNEELYRNIDFAFDQHKMDAIKQLASRSFTTK